MRINAITNFKLIVMQTKQNGHLIRQIKILCSQVHFLKLIIK